MIAISGFPVKSKAHPVSYKGSVGIMGQNSPIMSHNQINYSFQHWVASGIHYFKRPGISNRDGFFASSNFLIKRWNGKGLQANIYANIGLGESSLNAESKLAGLGLLQFDIENRNYYFLTKHLRIESANGRELAQSVMRIGIAPYVVNFEGMHSWLILEWQKTDFKDGPDVSDLTPFLRIFYKNLLFEIGQSFDGLTKFNYITHF